MATRLWPFNRPVNTCFIAQVSAAKVQGLSVPQCAVTDLQALRPGCRGRQQSCSHYMGLTYRGRHWRGTSFSVSGIASLTCLSVRLLWQQAGCKKWQGVFVHTVPRWALYCQHLQSKSSKQAHAIDTLAYYLVVLRPITRLGEVWLLGMLSCIGRGSGSGCCKASRLTRGGFSSSNDSTVLDASKRARVCCTRVICDVQGLACLVRKFQATPLAASAPGPQAMSGRGKGKVRTTASRLRILA
jgi:hypothetical protein